MKTLKSIKSLKSMNNDFKAGAAGRRVVVFQRDLATARAIIAETSGQDADDDQVADDDEPGFGHQ